MSFFYPDVLGLPRDWPEMLLFSGLSGTWKRNNIV